MRLRIQTFTTRFADSFEERASDAVMEADGASVLIDLSGVAFMDSAGIRALVRVLELRSGKSLIVQPSPQVFTLLHLLALTDGVLPKVEILEPPFLERPPVPDWADI